MPGLDRRLLPCSIRSDSKWKRGREVGAAVRGAPAENRSLPGIAMGLAASRACAARPPAGPTAEHRHPRRCRGTAISAPSQPENRTPRSTRWRWRGRRGPASTSSVSRRRAALLTAASRSASGCTARRWTRPEVMPTRHEALPPADHAGGAAERAATRPASSSSAPRPPTARLPRRRASIRGSGCPLARHSDGAAARPEHGQPSSSAEPE